MAFYNITPISSLDSKQWLQIDECNEGGTSLDAQGSNSARIYTSILFTPTAAGGSFQLKSIDGATSFTFTKDNVIEVNGSAHGKATTYLLYRQVRDLITL